RSSAFVLHDEGGELLLTEALGLPCLGDRLAEGRGLGWHFGGSSHFRAEIRLFADQRIDNLWRRGVQQRNRGQGHEGSQGVACLSLPARQHCGMRSRARLERIKPSPPSCA